VTGTGAITQWLARLKNGDVTAAASLWEEFRRRLKGLVRPDAAPWITGGAWDESDVALSAFALFCRALGEGRYQEVSGREDLWRLLATITLRKARDRARSMRTRKRGGDVLTVARDTEALDELACPLPTPDMQVLLNEECGRLLDLLPSTDLRTLALLRLEGYSNEEAAQSMGYTRRTIQRMLALIRRLWEAQGDEHTRADPQPAPGGGPGS
jgi:DNA-directed RNA polymerase specialized sigma24 family protein